MIGYNSLQRAELQNILVNFLLFLGGEFVRFGGRLSCKVFFYNWFSVTLWAILPYKPAMGRADTELGVIWEDWHFKKL